MPLLARVFDEKGEIHSGRNWLRWWFGMFLAGFFGIGLCGTVLAVFLWLLGGGYSLGNAMLIVLLASLGTGVFLGTVMTHRARSEQRLKREFAVRIPGHHPIIGDFHHVPIRKTWHALPLLPTGAAVGLWGSGPAPTDAQATLWKRFIASFDSAIRAAAAALSLPGQPFHGCQSLTLTVECASLREDGNLDLMFASETVPKDFLPDPRKYHPMEAPHAIFRPDLTLVAAGLD